MRKVNREDLATEASDTHQIREFDHKGSKIIEHIFIGFDRDIDNKPVNLMVWEKASVPKPYVHQRFKPSDNIDNVRSGVQNAFDGIDWDWWRERFDNMEKVERQVQEGDEE